MKSLRHLIAVAAVAFALPAQAGINDPEVLIYRVSGVIDNGGFGTTVFCTNFSGVDERIRIAVRDKTGTLVVNGALTVSHLNTHAFSTRDILLYDDSNLATGLVNPGTAAIAATSVNVTCTAMQVESAVTNPAMGKLHMTRFNPIAGTQE